MKQETVGEILSRAWYTLRLSVRCPHRVPTWDAILLTAASPQQALLYQWHLDQAKRRGMIHASTIAVAVPDPCGVRIGSGGATLHAIRVLADELNQVNQPLPIITSNLITEGSSNCIRNMKVLLVHAGGDSKRLPWANPMGKAFIPLPFLADDDRDRPSPSLFDHILALSASAAQHFTKEGGLLIMTGDVLPCYDFSCFYPPANGVCVLTVPTLPELAANHGVILSSSNDELCYPCSKGKQERQLEEVVDLLQKPCWKKLLDSGAIRKDGSVLLDTGIFAVQGKAWSELVELSLEEPDPVLAICDAETEISLYEELAGAWVPACHDWVRSRPLGDRLLKSLSTHCLYSRCAQGLSFLHFGTSSEVLSHLANDLKDLVGRRHMMVSLDTLPCKIAASAVVLSSEIKRAASIGNNSFVFNCTFMDSVHIGNYCVVTGITSQVPRLDIKEGEPFLRVPDQHCLWEVPVNGCLVALCCSVSDNPKLTRASMGTFCGKLWNKFLQEMGIDKNEIWPNLEEEKRNLWNAKLFAIAPAGVGLLLAMWLMGMNQGESQRFSNMWHGLQRLSMAGLHECIDFEKVCLESGSRQSRIASHLAKASLTNGLLDRDLSKLCTQIVEGMDMQACQKLMAVGMGLPDGILQVPASRIYQAQLDLCKAAGDSAMVNALEIKVWDAVVAETAYAVEQCKDSTNILCTYPAFLFPFNAVKVELPVRIDFVGGWSDTPPWSLERVGIVLNMAILLEGRAPIGAEITTMLKGGIFMSDDEGHYLDIDDPSVITTPFEIDDPFRLVKSALLVTGITVSSAFRHTGLNIRTWASVPRGSGLGTSSILAAAVVEGILRISGGNCSKQNITNLVLVLEQLMGTGGGWQDQIGGLYPGIKCTTSYPNHPLTLKVESIHINFSLHNQLEQRLLVFFTGQVRLAHQVLQNVVRRYLQRDAVLISTIEELIRLAERGKAAFEDGDCDEMGRIMLKTWFLHQELDPFCSNEFVDMVFKKVSQWAVGYKLVGAGGGGFGILLAKSEEAALSVKQVLKELSVCVYNWSICE